ncbi:MAG: hypothetical protein ACK5UG_04545 [Synechococcaceae cyanobacterium]|jgi:hypothetical protein
MTPPSRPRPQAAAPLVARAAGLLVLALAATAPGCSEAPLPEQRLRVDDCLQDVNPDRLQEAIRRCDRVVAAFPREPGPLNERYLLHTLAGNDPAACHDIRRAAALLKPQSAGVDPLLRQDVAQRLGDCPP